MGEIRIVGPGKTRGYPYPVSKKDLYLLKFEFYKCIIQSQLLFMPATMTGLLHQFSSTQHLV